MSTSVILGRSTSVILVTHDMCFSTKSIWLLIFVDVLWIPWSISSVLCSWILICFTSSQRPFNIWVETIFWDTHFFSVGIQTSWRYTSTTCMAVLLRSMTRTSTNSRQSLIPPRWSQRTRGRTRWPTYRTRRPGWSSMQMPQVSNASSSSLSWRERRSLLRCHLSPCSQCSRFPPGRAPPAGSLSLEKNLNFSQHGSQFHF